MQRQLHKNIKVFSQSNKVLVFADKTFNIYKLNNGEYKKLSTAAVTSTYKKLFDKIIDKTNTECKRIVENNVLLIINGNKIALSSYKNHQPNFLKHSETCLLKPAKNEIGRIRKTILCKIDVDLRNEINVNQWKNTSSIINWFKNIKNKQKS